METQLGQATKYEENYNPNLLCGVPRSLGRKKIATLSSCTPFHGVDIWSAYEISWLNFRGKPQTAIGEFHIPHNSPNLIESKSFKLYLNSFNQEKFATQKEVLNVIRKDLSSCAGVPVKAIFSSPRERIQTQIFDGICLDDLDVEIDRYEVDPDFLNPAINTHPSPTTSDLSPCAMTSFYTTLFKSNCLVTGQPDWAHIQIKYEGGDVDPSGLLKYLISYRRHQGFHEHCVENIWCDIMDKRRPKRLTVYARFTRRGGLDINPFRSNFEKPPKNQRTSAQ